MSENTSRHASFSLLRRWAIGFNVVVSAALLFAIVVMVNYLAARHHARFQWAHAGRLALSPLTREVLNSLTNDVQVTVLFDPGELSLFSEVKSLLAEYQAASPRVKVEFVNVARNKGRAEYILGQHRLTGTSETLLVFLETPGRPVRIRREKELGDYDVAAALQGQPLRRTGFKGEQCLTSDLLALADARPLRGYFLAGHGEGDLTDEDAADGYRRLAEILAAKNIQIERLSLRTNGVPADASLVLVAGPRHAIPADELLRLEQYLKAGGRALVLLYSPLRENFRRTGLDRVLAPFGVEVGDNLVIDRSQSLAGDTRTLITGQFGPHPITGPLQGSRIGLVMPCAVWPRPGTARAVDAPKADALLFTSPQGMVVSRVQNGQGTVETNGVIPLAVAAEKGAIEGVSADRGTARLVVVGEASFLANANIDAEANRDFATLAVNWLLDRRQLLNIDVRPVHEYRIALTQSQMRATAWILLGALPGGMLLLGGLVWLRRRK